MALRYEPRELVGVGGMGSVFATEALGDRPVVVKLMHDSLLTDAHCRARFDDEARTARQVRHRNVVRVVDDGVTDAGVPFVVMERVDGIPLGEVIERDGPLTLPRLRTIASQILAGLEAIHTAGFLHGDVKSDNVLVGASDHVTIIDFGLSRPAGTQPRALEDGLMSGTPEYMAPEIIRGEPIGIAAEIYAVGIIVYEMLTGRTPFAGGTSTEIFERHLLDDVVPPTLRVPHRTIPVALEAIVLRALAKDPEARHHNAGLFATAIERAIPVDIVERPLRDEASPRADGTRMTTRILPRAALQRTRDEVAEALVSGNADAVIVGYLGLAQELVEAHRTVDARRELEAAVGWLALQPRRPDETWRVLLTLAALRDGLGERDAAICAAIDARRAARDTGCLMGLRRANSLLRRLEVPQRRAGKQRP
jgi:serine/threonine protein kinase